MTAFPTVLIGFGKVADTLRHDARMASYFPEGSHAQILKRHTAFDWVAVADPSQEARGRASREWEIGTCVSDVSEIPEREKITAAVIASPPEGRLAVLNALPSLRAILVEKPLGGTIAQARAFVEACEARGIIVQVNYWRRAVPAFRTLADAGLKEAVGDVQAVFGLYGNGLMNNGSHLVDFLRMLCGGIEAVEGCGPARPAPASSVTGDREMACLLRLSNGASVALSPVEFSAWREVGLDIWGTQGRLSILQESLGMTRYRQADNRGLANEMEIDSDAGETSCVEVAASLPAMYDTLATAVAERSGLVSPAAEALKSEAVVQEILDRSEDAD